jgi:hypothetical protein
MTIAVGIVPMRAVMSLGAAPAFEAGRLRGAEPVVQPAMKARVVSTICPPCRTIEQDAFQDSLRISMNESCAWCA